MGGKSKQSGSQTVTQNPPAFQQPFLESAFREAAKIYANPFGYAQQPFSSVAPFSNQTQQGLKKVQQIATTGAGGQVNPLARQLARNTLSGNYLNPESNPYLSAQFEQAKQNFVTPGNLGFEAQGRQGSGLGMSAAANALTQATDAVYGQHYEQERARQQQMAAMAPALDETRYADASKLLGVGSALEGQGQRYLDEASGRFTFAQDRPQDMLNRYMSIVGGNGFGGSTTSPLYSNPAAGIAGGALTGLSLGGKLGGGGVPAAGTLLGGGGGATLGAAAAPPLWPFALGGAALGKLGS